MSALKTASAALLGQVIKNSKTIKRLILENNHIHARGAKALADALRPEKGQVSLLVSLKRQSSKSFRNI